MSQDIVIVDGEFERESVRVATDATSAEDVLARLITHLETMRDGGLIAGIAADIFKEYCELITSMKGELLDLALEEQRLIQNMIAEVDAADQYLYGG